MDSNAFYYIDGTPTKGLWINLAEVTCEADVLETLVKAGLTGSDYDGDLLVADVEGALARSFYYSVTDTFDLDGYIECRDEIDDEESVAAFIDWYGSWDHETFADAFAGSYESQEAFAEQLIDDTGMLDEMPEHLRCYFDVAQFARDLFCGDYYRDDAGFVFCANV